MCTLLPFNVDSKYDTQFIILECSETQMKHLYARIVRLANPESRVRLAQWESMGAVTRTVVAGPAVHQSHLYLLIVFIYPRPGNGEDCSGGVMTTKTTMIFQNVRVNMF